MSNHYDLLTVRITWSKGWLLLVAVPRIQFETLINRFDHSKIEVHAFVSHVDWCIITAKEIRVKSERVAYNAGWV